MRRRLTGNGHPCEQHRGRAPHGPLSVPRVLRVHRPADDHRGPHPRRTDRSSGRLRVPSRPRARPRHMGTPTLPLTVLASARRESVPRTDELTSALDRRRPLAHAVDSDCLGPAVPHRGRSHDEAQGTPFLVRVRWRQRESAGRHSSDRGIPPRRSVRKLRTLTARDGRGSALASCTCAV